MSTISQYFVYLVYTAKKDLLSPISNSVIIGLRDYNQSTLSDIIYQISLTWAWSSIFDTGKLVSFSSFLFLW